MTTQAKLSVRDMAYIGIFAALISVCAWIVIPAGAAPFTMQTFGIFVAVGLLGGRRGSLAVGLYLLLGLVGLPVFAGFAGGPGALLGTSGGYIIGFLLSALVMWGLEMVWGRGGWRLGVSMAAGLLACYLMGTIWFMVAYAQTSGAVGLWSVLMWCVIPYIPADLIKIALALVITRRLERYVR